jgi:predicted DNA-binding antitoxin AbrB/MazE fold protein
MTIAAKYQNGVFEPLAEVNLAEGTLVQVRVIEQPAPQPPKSVREFAAFGMWADRDDVPDGVTFVNRVREPHY